MSMVLESFMNVSNVQVPRIPLTCHHHIQASVAPDFPNSLGHVGTHEGYPGISTGTVTLVKTCQSNITMTQDILILLFFLMFLVAGVDKFEQIEPI
jgi:hypothetical protein